MKTNIHRLYTVFALGILFLFAACEQNDYLDDTGIHDANTPFNTYDYLAAHPYQYFDTLLTIIDHFQLEEEINQAGTFFAPTDRSIKLYLTAKQTSLQKEDENATYTLDDLLTNLPVDSVKQYLFNEKLLLDDLSTSETSFTTQASTSVRIQKVLQTDPSYYTWSTTPVYFLYYIKDIGLPNPVRVQCQTTGIKTQNGSGTILHVFRNTHVFASFTN
ncbi:hypothetical protein PQ465_09100 [Sphingobacterium oryzagri]|uniref:Fasciclin domain-containing protein n=1 Tax=Sphingobacterium oryzagri TaxID=3025669 RepID=A0ABY7WT72_9SPHI|nr:hypothetical protein [Sphingobacterium sp. KACC 22765]WDF70514.1 hypothetical protein PQ465_09100 [Sphingobacterium sp. KACC 22765]